MSREGDGEGWGVHLFMYDAQGGGRFRVEYAEVLGTKDGLGAQAACITELRIQGEDG